MYEKTEQEKLLDLYRAGSTDPKAENFDATDLLSQSLKGRQFSNFVLLQQNSRVL